MVSLLDKIGVMSIDLEKLSIPELLCCYADILEMLKVRKVVRSTNNPAGDLSELLFCMAFNWKQENNSKAGFDAIDRSTGNRYQIKGRRLTPANKSRELSAIRKLESNEFHYLAAILFAADFSIYKAVIIPHSTVLECSKSVEHTNSSKFLLTDGIIKRPETQDVTEKIKNTLCAIDRLLAESK